MNQNKLDELVDALRVQGLTWNQTNFAVSLVRNAVAAERGRCAALCESKRKVWDGSYVDRFETPGQCASEILGKPDTSAPGVI